MGHLPSGAHQTQRGDSGGAGAHEWARRTQAWSGEGEGGWSSRGPRPAHRLLQARPRGSLHPLHALFPEGTPHGRCLSGSGQGPERPRGQLAADIGPVLPRTLGWRPGGRLQALQLWHEGHPLPRQTSACLGSREPCWAGRRFRSGGRVPSPSAAGTPGQAREPRLWDSSSREGRPAPGTRARCASPEPHCAERESYCVSVLSPHAGGGPQRPRVRPRPAQGLGQAPRKPRRQQGRSWALPGPCCSHRALGHVPPIPRGPHGVLYTSVIQSLGCRFGSSSPAKGSAELPWLVGVWSQLSLSPPELAPAGGPREPPTSLGPTHGAVSPGRGLPAWCRRLPVFPRL